MNLTTPPSHNNTTQQDIEELIITPYVSQHVLEGFFQYFPNESSILRLRMPEPNVNLRPGYNLISLSCAIKLPSNMMGFFKETATLKEKGLRVDGNCLNERYSNLRLPVSVRILNIRDCSITLPQGADLADLVILPKPCKIRIEKPLVLMTNTPLVLDISGCVTREDPLYPCEARKHPRERLGPHPTHHESDVRQLRAIHQAGNPLVYERVGSTPIPSSSRRRNSVTIRGTRFLGSVTIDDTQEKRSVTMGDTHTHHSTGPPKKRGRETQSRHHHTERRDQPQTKTSRKRRIRSPTTRTTRIRAPPKRKALTTANKEVVGKTIETPIKKPRTAFTTGDTGFRIRKGSETGNTPIDLTRPTVTPANNPEKPATPPPANYDPELNSGPDVTLGGLNINDE